MFTTRPIELEGHTVVGTCAAWRADYVTVIITNIFGDIHMEIYGGGDICTAFATGGVH